MRSFRRGKEIFVNSCAGNCSTNNSRFLSVSILCNNYSETDTICLRLLVIFCSTLFQCKRLTLLVPNSRYWRDSFSYSDTKKFTLTKGFCQRSKLTFHFRNLYFSYKKYLFPWNFYRKKWNRYFRICIIKFP